MKLHALPSGPIGTIGYLILAPERGEAVLIDAPDGIWSLVKPLLEKSACRLVELWITHGHWDHTQGAAEIVAATGANVCGHQADQRMFETPEMMKPYMMPGIEVTPFKVDHWVVQGECFEALGLSVEVRHVPGHCPGNVLYYLKELKSAFVGDALFCGSVGRTDIPGADFATLENSVRGQIYTLPEETVVYPGHGQDTTVGDERASNPYISG